jgi:hypothetical protein
VGSRGFGQRLLFLIGRADRKGLPTAQDGTNPTARRLPISLVWCAGAAAATTLAVQVTGKGIDVLVIVLLCCGVVVLERTLGDWLSDLIGAVPASLLFAVLVGSGVWMLFAEGGKVGQFYTAAERRGYHTVYHHEFVAGPQSDTAAANGTESSPSSTARSGEGAAILPRVPQEPPTTVVRPAAKAVATSSGFRQPASNAAPTPVVRIEAPQMGVIGRSVTIRAHVTAGSEPLAGANVEWAINGRAVGTSVTDAAGAASSAFVPRQAGTYQLDVRVAVPSRRAHQPSARMLFYVVPGVSSLLRPVQRLPAVNPRPDLS